MESYSYSSPGPRSTNQDFILDAKVDADTRLVCVADGVGGNNGGEIASKTAVEEFSKSFLERSLSMEESVLHAHDKIREIGAENSNLHGMATTLTALYVHDLELLGVHVGDSRAYILRGDGVMQLSMDHSEVARYLREGKLTKEEAANYPRKNVLYNALGMQKKPEVQTFKFSLEAGDRLALMSDGVSGVVSKRTFRNLSKSSKTIEEFGEKLVSRVENGGVSDNYSIILLGL